MIRQIWSHKLGEKIDFLYDKNLRELQNKLTKIVVFFAVATAPLRCFAISLQEKFYQFSFT